MPSQKPTNDKATGSIGFTYSPDSVIKPTKYALFTLPVKAKLWAESHLVLQTSLPLRISPPGEKVRKRVDLHDKTATCKKKSV